MDRLLFSLQSYLVHILKRKDEHALHSPFLFDFYNQTVNKKKAYVVRAIELARGALLKDPSVVSVYGFGKKTSAVSSIARSSLASVGQAAFLGSLTNYIAPASIVELGTSLGISTAYLGYYAPSAKVVSLDGNLDLLEQARKIWKKLGLGNIESISGDFEESLPKALGMFTALDLVFFDGNHQHDATLHYFEQCLPLAHDHSVFVFHDIYWSSDMSRAWKRIVAHPRVMLSLDLYYFGIVFFRRAQPKQHFVLKF